MNGLKAQSMADARKLLYYERYDGAVHQLQALLTADPNNTEAWWLLTQVYLHRHQLQQIRDSLQQMAASLSEQPFALCAKGQILNDFSFTDQRVLLKRSAVKSLHQIIG
jgi:predicted Zn-dependent protease